MSFASHLASLALHTLGSAAELAGAQGAGRLARTVTQLAGDRYHDHSRRLLDALARATERAWHAVEVALAGDSLRDRLRAMATRAEDRIFAGQVQTFLATVPLGDSDDVARRKALAELRHARQAGILATELDTAHLEAALAPLQRYTQPTEFVAAQEAALTHLATTLHDLGYVYLSRVLLARPAGGAPLLLVALSYFFRRAVEADETLFRGLALERLEQLDVAQESGFAALELAIDLQTTRLTALLDDVHAVAVQTRDAVVNLQGQVATQNAQLQQIGQAVEQLLEQRELLRREVRPGDSLSIRTDDELRLVRQLIARYRSLPESDRRLLPNLLNSIGKLEVVAGDFDSAQRDFQTVASLVQDGHLRAEAQANAYRAALERRDWAGAMQALSAAMALDAKRYAPFPLDTYQPERVLGAGGFGVAFLCQHRYMQARVVVKALWLDAFGADADKVFTEARVLKQLDHPGIIRITECGYVDPARRDRPYLVMDHFDGVTLEEVVTQHGPFQVADYLDLARPICEGLQAAHAAGILHGDVKPANLLVRPTAARTDWQVKLIDFGLATRHQLTPAGLGNTTRNAHTLLGHTIAGTLAYAAPEQLAGGGALGPPADVYAFARTSCYLLFGTTDPLPRHWRGLPRELAELLGRCLEKSPKDRPQDFAAVLAELQGVAGDAPRVAPLPKAAEGVDLEAATSMLELLRHTRRLVNMGLFGVAGRTAYPLVARSEFGGYEVAKAERGRVEHVHPAQEMLRLVDEERRRKRELDPRIVGQVASLTALARKQLEGRPWSLVAIGGTALAMMVVSSFFGLMIPVGPLGVPGVIISIVLTSVGGAAFAVLGVLTIVLLFQRSFRNTFCAEVVEQLEPLTGGPAQAPPAVWPQGAEAKRILQSVIAAVVLTAAFLCGTVAEGNKAMERAAKPVPPVQKGR